MRINSAFFLDRELDKRMWKSGVQEVIRTIRKSPRVPNDREKYFKSAILPMYLDQVGVSLSHLLGYELIGVLNLLYR